MSKPITNKVQTSSPLKNTGDIPKKKGKATVNKGGYKVEVDDAVNIIPGKEGQPAVERTKLYSDLPESQRAAAREYNQKKYGTHNPTKEGKANNKITVQDAVPATPPSGKRTIEEKPLVTEARDASKVDTFYPWEARFAKRTQKIAARDEIKRGKRGMRQLNRALNKGVISQEEYDKEFGQAQKLAYGQGNINQSLYGIEGGVQGTERLDAITSQGYQANRVNSIRTDYKRKLNEEQQAGQRVKADGTEDMTYEEYAGNATPKTSPKVQSASAGASKPETASQAKASKAEVKSEAKTKAKLEGSVNEAKDFDLRGTGSTAPMGSEGPANPTPKQARESSTDMFGETTGKTVVGGKGIASQDDLSDLKIEDNITAADRIFGSDGIVFQDPKTPGTVGGKSVAESNPMENIEAPTRSGPEKMNESYGIDIEDAAAQQLEEDLAASAFKMKRAHNARVMYGSSPAKMWGPQKQGANNTDTSGIDNGAGTPVTQDAKAKLKLTGKNIITGKKGGFKMRGYGKK